VQEVVEQAVERAVQAVLTEVLKNCQLQEQLQQATQPSTLPKPPRGKQSMPNRLWQATTESVRRPVQTLSRFGRSVGMSVLAAGGLVAGVVCAARKQIASVAPAGYRYGKRLVHGAISALMNFMPSFAGFGWSG
jgi:hypothetical protein